MVGKKAFPSYDFVYFHQYLSYPQKASFLHIFFRLEM